MEASATFRMEAKPDGTDPVSIGAQMFEDDDRHFLHAVEVADALEVSVRTLRRIAKRGWIKSTRVGRSYRFRPSWVREYLEAGLNGPEIAKAAAERDAIANETPAQRKRRMASDLRRRTAERKKLKQRHGI